MREETIKRILDVDVDGLNGFVTYTIKEMYNLIDEEDFATIEFKTIDEFTMSFSEIKEQEGKQGHSMKTEIYNIYGIEN